MSQQAYILIFITSVSAVLAMIIWAIEAKDDEE